MFPDQLVRHARSALFSSHTPPPSPMGHHRHSFKTYQGSGKTWRPARSVRIGTGLLKNTTNLDASKKKFPPKIRHNKLKLQVLLHLSETASSVFEGGENRALRVVVEVENAAAWVASSYGSSRGPSFPASKTRGCRGHPGPVSVARGTQINQQQGRGGQGNWPAERQRRASNQDQIVPASPRDRISPLLLIIDFW